MSTVQLFVNISWSLISLLCHRGPRTNWSRVLFLDLFLIVWIYMDSSPSFSISLFRVLLVSLFFIFFPLALHHYYNHINVNFILGVIVWINVPLGKCSSTCLRVQLLGHGLSETSALPGIPQCFPKCTNLCLYEKCIRVLILSYITNTLYYVAL